MINISSILPTLFNSKRDLVKMNCSIEDYFSQLTRIESKMNDLRKLGVLRPKIIIQTAHQSSNIEFQGDTINNILSSSQNKSASSRNINNADEVRNGESSQWPNPLEESKLVNQ